MLLMMRAPDSLYRLRVPLYGVMIPSLCGRAGQMILGAAAGGVALLDVFDAGGSEGVGEDVFGDAVCSACSDAFVRKGVVD